ncbi:leucine-rich repeat protein [Clostridium butyricum]|uniref:leucine-rich repeat protein n=1 Tax=Clostridium butyricum TaxID=1492 RepID=UPI0029080BE1|nr:leucine-rich repeat protein [Clostridium butyricum]MDU4856408.1 leucine-rich repeat protein [Clostridioides difficile]
MNIIDKDEILNNVNNNIKEADKIESAVFFAGSTDIKYFKFNDAVTYVVVYANPDNKETMPASIIIPTYYNSKPVAGITVDGFKNIDSLEKVYMGKEMKAIANSAFEGCSNLISVTIETDNVPKIGANVFKNTSDNLIIYVPESMVDPFKEDESWKIYSSRIKAINGSDIPDVPTIAENNGSVNVVVPTVVNSNNVTIINNFYFYKVDNYGKSSKEALIINDEKSE